MSGEVRHKQWLKSICLPLVSAYMKGCSRQWGPFMTEATTGGPIGQIQGIHLVIVHPPSWSWIWKSHENTCKAGNGWSSWVTCVAEYYTGRLGMNDGVNFRFVYRKQIYSCPGYCSIAAMRLPGIGGGYHQNYHMWLSLSLSWKCGVDLELWNSLVSCQVECRDLYQLDHEFFMDRTFFQNKDVLQMILSETEEPEEDCQEEPLDWNLSQGFEWWKAYDSNT